MHESVHRAARKGRGAWKTPPERRAGLTLGSGDIPGWIRYVQMEKFGKGDDRKWKSLKKSAGN